MKIRGESGQLMVIVAVGMVVFLGFAALAIDLGRGYSERRLAQNGADAAALAGMRLVREQAGAASPLTGAQIYTAIQQVAAQNGNAQLLPDSPSLDGGAVFLDANKIPLSGGNVQSWSGTDFSSVYGLRVKTRTQYSTLFAGVFGYSQMTSNGIATAMSLGVDDTALLPIGVKTWAQCGAPFGFDNPPSTDQPYWTHALGWKFFTNDPGVPGGVGWVSLDGSNASDTDMKNWVVDGFKPGVNANAAGFQWWTNYRWYNSVHPSGPDYGGWAWDSTPPPGWYTPTTPAADPNACDGYYDDGGGFDWTNPGPPPASKKGPPVSWGNPPPPMPSSPNLYNLQDVGSMHPTTGTDSATIIGHTITWMKQRTGVGGSSAIQNAISNLVGHDVMVLVYNRTDGSGTGAKLQIIGVLAFKITQVTWNGANSAIWGKYEGAVLPGTPTGTPNAGMISTVRLVAN